MAITANVVDGVLDYTYTSSSDTTTSGSDMGYEQFLQLLCAEMQYQDPLEPTTNTEYVAQLATFSQLEATLALQSTQDNTYASTLVGKEVILAVDDSKGNTSYVNGNVDYVVFQNGSPYLSVNGSLYPFEDLDTIVDSAYYEAVSLAETFNSMVSTLPSKDTISYVYEGAVSEIRELYDGMTDYQKQYISSDTLSTFEAIETRVKELVAAQNAAANQDGTADSEETSEELAASVENIEDTTQEKAAEEAAEDTISPAAVAALLEDSVETAETLETAETAQMAAEEA